MIGYCHSDFSVSKYRKLSYFLVILNSAIAVVCIFSFLGMRIKRDAWRVIDVVFFIVKIMLFILARSAEKEVLSTKKRQVQ